MDKNFDEFDGKDYSNMIDEAKTRELSALRRSKASRLRDEYVQEEDNYSYEDVLKDAHYDDEMCF